MDVIINKTRAQTLMPIIINVQKAPTAPSLLVTPKDPTQNDDSFMPSVKAIGTNYQSDFWFEKPGDYELIVTSQNQHFQQTLSITPHEFLPFHFEFGLFTLLLLFLFIGVVLWMKQQKA